MTGQSRITRWRTGAGTHHRGPFGETRGTHHRGPFGETRSTHHRGQFGAPRPAALAAVPLPPAAMPSHLGATALEAWRYVGVYGPEIMLCAATVRIGRARQAFWALWDRQSGSLYERTSMRARGVVMATGGLLIHGRGLIAELTLDEEAGIEVVCPNPAGYAWTRKQGGVRARGRIVVDGRERSLDARAVIDDTAAYYPRHTRWRWSAGVGLARDGRELAWNLVSGINDPAEHSERTIWIDGESFEPPPCEFSPDLSAVDSLAFHAEAGRERDEDLLIVRSRYRQPFGTFSGRIPAGGRFPAGLELSEGYGVMEEHDVRW